MTHPRVVIGDIKGPDLYQVPIDFDPKNVILAGKETNWLEYNAKIHIELS
jgi:hypothetical protein